ncbi:MAG: VCBS repeat-containing protein [Bacteroidota bacterium]
MYTRRFIFREVQLLSTLTFVLLLFMLGCDKKKETVTDLKQFTLLPSSETGIDFSNVITDTKQANILLYNNFYGGAGVGVGDFNNDGLLDIYFAGNQVADRLYLNKGNLHFEEATKQAGIQDDGGWSTGVTLADVNGDGNLDIYVSRELYDHKPELRENLLYINQGDGTFSEKAKAYGINSNQRTRHATFLDYDKDGDLDLFLLTQPPNPGNFSEFRGANLKDPEYAMLLYQNNGDRFEEVSASAGVSLTGFPNGVSASDVNNDGWPDLYVANDFNAPDLLLINNQDGTFTNRLEESVNHTSFYSMGVDVADINNDALLDVFVLDMVAEDNFRQKSNMSGMDREAFWRVYDEGGYYQYMYNSLQLNNGNTTFSDVAQLTGMAATDWSWANLIADFDNDGLKDVYITNGLLRDIRNTDADKAVGQYVLDTANEWISENPNAGDISIWDILDLDEALAILPSQPLKNYAFQNKGNLQFEKTSDTWGLDQESFSNGAAYADFDNDGDLDIIVNNINQEAFVYRNNAEQQTDTNYLRLSLSDTDGQSVFGTKVFVHYGGEVQMVETTNVRGIYSTSEPTVHFGLGSYKKVDSIVVRWPNNTQTVKKKVAANTTMTLQMGEGTLFQSKNPSKKHFFNEVTQAFPFQERHIENEYDDYEKQVLLPHKLSQFGPALAVADINNDGLEDVYLGGASGRSGGLFVQTASGEFQSIAETLWKGEAPYEDVDALFLDVDGDGWQDLFVVSGGNEHPANAPYYLDRLYMNKGGDTFSKAAILNAYGTSGSKVVAEDYDNDGDLDLFVGGRHLPHQYPMPTASCILQNNNGQLVNITENIAPELLKTGMVTDALWSDYDKDGDKDLVVTGEWMPITIFKNENGNFSKQEIPSLEKTRGWWFSLAKGDFDGDGDEDFIGGNIGLNYKYKTSPEQPFDVYFNDFDQNDSKDIVLGYYNDDKHYPLRGFSCSSAQVPALKDKIKKYDEFASLELESVYGSENLKESLHYQADTFASSYIENLGEGAFRIVKLPRSAQYSSINAILVEDYNQDGHLDALIAGNLFTSEIETPRNDAGTGVLMLGDGKGGFQTKPFQESGFFANKDVKHLRKIKYKTEEIILVANNNDRLQSFKIN